MEHIPDSILHMEKKATFKNGNKRRTTTLTRVERSIHDEVKELSKRIGEPMSTINGRALREYIDYMKSGTTQEQKC